jgi:hypothetical protein
MWVRPAAGGAVGVQYDLTDDLGPSNFGFDVKTHNIVLAVRLYAYRTAHPTGLAKAVGRCLARKKRWQCNSIAPNL